MPRPPRPHLARSILEKALQVFAEKGFHAASLEEIAVSLGLSKGAVYLHFPSKRDLFRAVLLQVENRETEFPRPAEDRDPVLRLRALLLRHLRFYQRFPEAWRLRWILETELRGDLPGASNSGIRAVHRRLRAEIRTLLQQAARRGRVRSGDAALDAFHLACGLEGALAQVAASPSEVASFLSPEAFVDSLLAPILRESRRRRPSGPPPPEPSPSPEPDPEDFQPPF